MTAARILVIDDEKAIRRMLRLSLEGHGYIVSEAETAISGLRSAVYPMPDLILLDLLLPDGDGFEILKRVREFSRTPIIVISALSDDQQKIALLDAGADDYLTKPFSIGELLARIRVALRREQDRDVAGALSLGDLAVDPATREVRRDGAAIHLTPTEYGLLTLFIQNAGRVLTRETIIQRIWGVEQNETGSLRVHIAQLRKKLRLDDANRVALETLPGVGYRLYLRDAPAAPPAS